jgi:hypothetical protein
VMVMIFGYLPITPPFVCNEIYSFSLTIKRARKFILSLSPYLSHTAPRRDRLM